MKQGKRWMACLLALVLCVSVFAPVLAFAAEEAPLFFDADFAEVAGKSHTWPGATGQVDENLEKMWKNLKITITDEDGNPYTSPNYFVKDSEKETTLGWMRRFGGMWPLGKKLTITIDMTSIKEPYHISLTSTGGKNKGWVTQGGYTSFTILHQKDKAESGNPGRIAFGLMSVEFDLQGGNIGGQTEKITKTVKTDNTVDFPQDPVKDGLHFANWYTQYPDQSDELPQNVLGKRETWTQNDKFSDYDRDWRPFNDPAFDKKYDGVFRLRALWEAEVTFNTGNGGTPIAPVRVEEGKTLTAPQEPTRSGYVFKGWKTQDSNDFDFATPVTKNMTLTAKWDKKPSSGGSTGTTDTTIYVDPNGGQFSDGSTAVKSYAVTVGERFTLPEAPIREGYKFLYWKGSEYQPGENYIVPAGGHTFVAEWEKDEKKPEDKPSAPSVDSNIKTPRGSALTHDEIAKILQGMKNTVPAIPKAGVGR